MVANQAEWATVLIKMFQVVILCEACELLTVTCPDILTKTVTIRGFTSSSPSAPAAAGTWSGSRAYWAEGSSHVNFNYFKSSSVCLYKEILCSIRY